MNVSLHKGDLTKFSADALVSAADTSLRMNVGVAAALRKAGGKDVEEEALELAPIELGRALATTAGKLNAKFVIHAITIQKQGEPARADSIISAAQESLTLADSLECETIAFPALGCGEGGFAVLECARLLLPRIRSFSGDNLKHAFVVLFSEVDFKAFESVATEFGIAQAKYVLPKMEAPVDSESRDSPGSVSNPGSEASP